jgi:integrase
MPRPATGQVRVDRRRRSPTFGLRFRAYGRREYVTLGTAEEGWTHAKAETELQNVLADVRRGIWQPPVAEVVSAPREVPTFHVFASEWFERQKVEGGRRGNGLSNAGTADLAWRLSNHLLPVFASRHLNQITVEDVDRYRLGKVREGKLGVTSINKTLTTLATILEAAVEYELIDRNPARGRRRRLPATTPRRSWLDRADHIAALLDGAGTLDDEARVCHGQRRALLATLTFAGLRLGEALSLRWQDVDLTRRTITVRTAKTDAGVRTVNLLPVLHNELGDYREHVHRASNALVFCTTAGHRLGATNIRRRILDKAVTHANAKLAGNGAEPLPEGLTPHSLRRTFASLLFALGETPPYVRAQMGTQRRTSRWRSTPGRWIAATASLIDSRLSWRAETGLRQLSGSSTTAGRSGTRGETVGQGLTLDLGQALGCD